ncbi:MAG: DUF2203 domain-containing protein [Chloroflexota bacterium]
MERLFTVEEANDLLSTLAPMLQSIAETLALLHREEEIGGPTDARARSNGHAQARPSTSSAERVVSLRDRLRRDVGALTDLGVQLKDPSMGLIDFPSLRDGRVVLLCWRLGEPTVAFWHETDTGYAGRQPL